MAIRRAIAVSLACVWAGVLSRPMAQSVNPETRRAEMHDHYAQLIAIHDAVVQGNLAAIREPAAELAILWVPAGSPVMTASFGAAIREGARRVSRETTIAGAAGATADIIRACAGCHRVSGAKISSDAVLQRRGDRSGRWRPTPGLPTNCSSGCCCRQTRGGRVVRIGFWRRCFQPIRSRRPTPTRY
jgi:hypothetical protein